MEEGRPSLTAVVAAMMRAAHLLLDDESRSLLAMIKAMGAARGEPLLSAFEPTTLAVRVKELGFTQVWDFGPEEANARYFAGRTDGLCATPSHHLTKARVGSSS